MFFLLLKKKVKKKTEIKVKINIAKEFIPASSAPTHSMSWGGGNVASHNPPSLANPVKLDDRGH